jgi:hypothetical protein
MVSSFALRGLGFWNDLHGSRTGCCLIQREVLALFEGGWVVLRGYRYNYRTGMCCSLHIIIRKNIVTHVVDGEMPQGEASSCQADDFAIATPVARAASESEGPRLKVIGHQPSFIMQANRRGFLLHSSRLRFLVERRDRKVDGDQQLRCHVSSTLLSGRILIASIRRSHHDSSSGVLPSAKGMVGVPISSANYGEFCRVLYMNIAEHQLNSSRSETE